MTVVTILIVIGVFCLLILSHEFGHFIVAKACGVYVEAVSYTHLDVYKRQI